MVVGFFSPMHVHSRTSSQLREDIPLLVPQLGNFQDKKRVYCIFHLFNKAGEIYNTMPTNLVFYCDLQKRVRW